MPDPNDIAAIMQRLGKNESDISALGKESAEAKKMRISMDDRIEKLQVDLAGF